MSVTDKRPYAPKRLGRTWESPPAVRLKPIKLSLTSLLQLADADAGRLLTQWLRNHPGGSPRDTTALAWGEVRYAQGFADGLRRANDGNVELLAALDTDLVLLDEAVCVSEQNRNQAEEGQYTHLHGLHRYNEGGRDVLAKVVRLVRKATA